MKSVFFILITLGLNYSVLSQNNEKETVYFEGGDDDVKIQLRIDANYTSKEMKFKLRHEDKTYSSIQGTSNLIPKYNTGIGEGFLGLIEKPITGKGTLFYLTGSTNDFYEDFRKVKSYNLYKPVDGGKILNWLLKD
jgi:hypothetical protein